MLPIALAITGPRNRAGTLNLNIRYGQMTLALVAQAAIHQMRQRLGEPFSHWDASHLARDIFGALEGDVRVKDDTILVTYYNAPHQDCLRQQYENLPDKLQTRRHRTYSTLALRLQTRFPFPLASLCLDTPKSNYLPLQNLCLRGVLNGPMSPFYGR